MPWDMSIWNSPEAEARTNLNPLPNQELVLDSEDILAKFDDCLAKGEISYEKTIPDVLESDDIRIALRAVPSFKNKPLDPSQGPAQSQLRTKPDDGSDIDHADPAFFVTYVQGCGWESGDAKKSRQPMPGEKKFPDRNQDDLEAEKKGFTHKLIFNKFCVVRPQYLLLTIDPLDKQTSQLDIYDFSAALQILDALEKSSNKKSGSAKTDDWVVFEKSAEANKEKEKREFFVLFNCGPKAGSSRMHKHMQVFPVPTVEDDGMELDANITMGNGPVMKQSTLPYKFYRSFRSDWSLKGETQDAIASKLHERVCSHLKWCREDLHIHDGNEPIPHNVILTRSWVMTIPRSSATDPDMSDHVVNAAGMLGHVWAGNDEQAKGWRDVCKGGSGHSLGDVYNSLGVPKTE